MSGLLVGLLLLLGNAFFVGAEFALISTRRSQIEPLARAGGRRATTALGAIDHLSLMMAGAQLGITVCSLGLGAAAEPAVAGLLDPLLGPLSPDARHVVSFLVSLAIVVYLHILVGEMVPKNLALAAPERSALLLAPPLAWIVRLLGPLIAVLNATANGMLRLLRVQPTGAVASAYTRAEVAALVGESAGAGLLDEEDRTLLAAALSLDDRVVTELLAPTATLVTVDRSVTTGDLQRLVGRTGFSRFPVRSTAPGRLAGYVHIGDVLDLLEVSVPLPPDRIRPLPVVRSDGVLGEVLAELREAGGQVAEVRDASGTTLGVLFFDDVRKALIGER